MIKSLAVFSGIGMVDLKKAKEFYGGLLGLELAEEDMGLHFKLPGGGKLFMYEKPDQQPATYTYLNFVVEDIDETVDDLVENGVVFERYDYLPVKPDNKGILRGLKANMGPDIAWFKDPFGNIIAVIQEK